MQITRFDKATATPAHGAMLAAAALPPGADTPFGHAYGYLEAGQAMELDRHTHPEVYLLCDGEGIMEVGGERAEMHPGDTVYIPGDVPHRMFATAARHCLFVALWWPKEG